MSFFEKFSLPISFSKKKTLGISAPVESPILGQTIPYKTIATFDLTVEKPKYIGDIPDATVKFYPLD